MAKITNNPELHMTNMSAKCSHCVKEIELFILALIASDSIVDPGLEKVGFEKHSVVEMRGIFQINRRRYRYDICGCGSSIEFFWKKAKVKLIDITCPEAEA